MDIKQLNAFVTVADTRSFKEAAHILYMSHSQVSKLVKSLEEDLGYEVLVRSKNGVFLNENGRKLYSGAVRILKEIDAIEMISPAEKEASFSILAAHGLSMHSVFAGFITENNLDTGFFNYYESSIQPKMKDIYSGRYDMGFTVLETARKTAFEIKLREQHLIFIPVKTTDAVLYMRKGHPMTSCNPVNADILANMQYVQLRGGLYIPRVRSGFTNTKKEAFYSDHVGMITNSLSAVFEIVKKTDMVYVGCDIFGNYETGNNIITVPICHDISSVEFGYIIREDTGLSENAELFLDYISNDHCPDRLR